MSFASKSPFTILERHSVVLGFSLAAAFVFGCSKPSPEEQKKKEAELTSAIASAMAQGATPSTAPAAAAAAPGGFVGSCTDKESFHCNEWTGALPLGSEDSCKIMNGVFSKADRCPDKLGASPLAGTCLIKYEGDERVKKAFYYVFDNSTVKDTVESAKVSCEVQSGTFTAAPAPAAAPAAAAAKPKKK